jgi:hypothetical protein
MLQGIMTLWFVQTILFTAFVAVDSRLTPESPVLKWGFIIVTLYSGPIGLVLWLLACREPLPGLHERYVTARWRQVVGSTMHCVAGDGIGILAAAVVASLLHLPGPVEAVFEYAAGFLFGWMIFQALFMRDMMGGAYGKALAATFYAELVSMNGVMAGDDDRHHALARGPGRPRPRHGGLLVHHVHRPDGRIPGRLSHQLVAGGPRLEARDDDHKADGARRDGRT